MTSFVFAFVLIVATVAVQGKSVSSVKKGVKATNEFVKLYNNYYGYEDQYKNMYAEDATLYAAGYEPVEGNDLILRFRKTHDIHRKLYINTDEIMYEKKKSEYVVTGSYETKGEGGIERGTFMNVYKKYDGKYLIYAASYNIYEAAAFYHEYEYGTDGWYCNDGPGLIETAANEKYVKKASDKTKLYVEYYNNYDVDYENYKNLYAEDATLYPAGYEPIQGKDAIMTFRQNHDYGRTLSMDYYGGGGGTNGGDHCAEVVVSGEYETYGDGGVEKGTYMFVYKPVDDNYDDLVISYMSYNIYQPAEYYYDEAEYLGMIESYANEKTMYKASAFTKKFVDQYNKYQDYPEVYKNLFSEDAQLYPSGQEVVYGKDEILAFRQSQDYDRKLVVDFDSAKIEKKTYGYIVSGEYKTEGKYGDEYGDYLNRYTYYGDELYITFAAYNIYQPADYYKLKKGSKYSYGIIENFANAAYLTEHPKYAENKQ